MNPVEKFKEILNSFSMEDSFHWWEKNASRPELMVYKIDTKTKKLSLRAYDDTSSTKIYERLIYVDFGGDGRKNNPVNRIMDVTGLSFLDAVNTFLSWEGSEVQALPKWEREKDKKSEPAPYKNSYLRKMILNRKLPEYSVLAKELFRACDEEQQRYAESVLHIGFQPSDNQYEARIFIPEMDINGIPYGSYRYNRSVVSQKGLLRSNSKRVLFGAHMFPKFGRYRMCLEGHSDVVTNISRRYACFTTGSSTKGFGENLKDLKGNVLYDFPDLDLPGMKGAMLRATEIKAFNLTCFEHEKITHIIFWWADWMRSKKIYQKIIEKKVEKQDPFYVICDRIPLKKEHAFFNKDLLKMIQRQICEKNKWNFEELSIDNWKVIYKDKSLEEGFDWTDFHQQPVELKTELLNFLDKKVKY